MLASGISQGGGMAHHVGCLAGEAQTTLELCERFTQCDGGVEVALCSLPGGGHVLYDNPRNFDIAAAAWAMFERQPR